MKEQHTPDKFVSVDRYYISGLHPHIWKHPKGEMVYFDDYVNLWAEKERLKAENERLRLQVGTDAIDREHGMCCDSSAENARLKAKVERLTEERCFLNERLNHFVKETVKNREQVERLRKAGDAMERSLSFAYPDSPKIKEWNAAKEGRPNE